MSEELKVAQARIACLEGEISKRDAKYQREVYGLNNEGDPIGGDPAGGYANDNLRLRAELAAIKAQEPVEYQLRALIRDVTNIPEAGYYMPQSWHDQVIALSLSGKLDAPVSEAKAKGVVMPERRREAETDDEFSAWVRGWNACLDEVARLNAAHVQHPDDDAVDRFAVAMKVKLAASREKGRHGWQNATGPHLSSLLHEHMFKGDPLDVGNLAMMLHQNGQAIELPHDARRVTPPVHQVSVTDERAAFEREDRYIVIKRSDMDRIPNQKVVHSFLGALGELSAHSVRIPQRKFLVIESDWPEYDPAWKLIQDRVQGRPILDAAPAAPAADAELEARIVWLECEAQVNAAPVSEAKAQGVVMLPSVTEVMNIVFDYQHNKNKNVTGTTNWAANIGMAVIDEIARLNATPVMPEHQFCEYCGGNDEEPQDHCMDCTRPVQQVSVPDGWKLVPVEPTLDMGWAYVDAANDASPGKCNSFNHFGYRAMIAAAPAAPAADAGLVEALDYQVLFDAIAAATSVYANGAINISVQAFRAALAAHRAKGVA